MRILPRHRTAAVYVLTALLLASGIGALGAGLHAAISRSADSSAPSGFTLQPKSIQAGESITLRVRGATGNTTLTIRLNGERIRGYSHTTDAYGNYSVDIPVPASAVIGEHTVTVSSPYMDGVTLTFTVTKTMKQSTIVVTPTTLQPNESANLAGKHWYSGARTVILLHPNGFAQKLKPLFDTCLETTCPTGELSMGIRIPSGTKPRKGYILLVQDSVGGEAMAEIEIVKRKRSETSIKVHEPEVRPGEQVTVSGEGFAAEAKLTASLGKQRIRFEYIQNPDSPYLTKNQDARTDSLGEFDVAFATIPVKTKPGTYVLTVTDDEGNDAEAEVVVVPFAKSSSSASSEAASSKEASSGRPEGSKGTENGGAGSSSGKIPSCDSYTLFNRPERCKAKSSAPAVESDDDSSCDRYTLFSRPERCKMKRSSSAKSIAVDKCDPSQYQFIFNIPAECKTQSSSSPAGTKLTPAECALIPGSWNRPPECKEYNLESMSQPLRGAITLATGTSVDFLSLLVGSVTYAPPQLAGSYRCWSMNVGGAGGSCTSTALILNKNKTYKFSSTKGTFKVKGDKIHLSKSTLWGPGQIIEGGRQIRFTYEYEGLQHTVTYLRQGGAPANSRKPEGGEGAPTSTIIPVTVVITFSPETATDSISTVSLMPEGGGERYDALAVQDSINRQIITGYFRSVPTGRTYTLMVGPGDVNVGSIDLRTAQSEQTINVNGKIRWD